MPKDEFDFEDPFALNGMVFLTREDTTDEMAETFIEEFIRMGYGPRQILALFHNPHYLGPNLALEKRGEPFIRGLITEVFARWGRAVAWPDSSGGRGEKASTFPASIESQSPPASASAEAGAGTLTDPMGAPIPKLTV